jgi:signal transduction histidine kinase
MRKLFALTGQVFSGLRFRLLLMVVLACAPLVILIVHASGADRRRATDGWRARSQRVLKGTLHQQEETIDKVEQLLLALSEASDIRALEPAGCKKCLEKTYAAYRRYANLGVVLTNGEILASVRPVTSEEERSHQAHFHRASQRKALAIADAPVRCGDDQRTIGFAYPVLDGAGTVLALVFAEVYLYSYERPPPEVSTQLTRGSTWTEIDSQGIVLARYPNPGTWVGKPLPEKGVLAVIQQQQDGVVKDVDSKGVPTVYAFNSRKSKLARANITGILSTSQSALFAEADRILRQNLSWLGLAAGMTFFLGWFGSHFLILRPVKALVRSSMRLASGDLTVRTGLPHTRDELGRLTLAFDNMAETLQQREVERQRTSQKLQVLSHRLVEVQETERRHIARELHDEIGQSLTAAEMNLQAALQLPGTTALARRLEDSIHAVERVLEQVHDLSLNLRPSMLDDLGLEPALRWYTQRTSGLSGLQAEFRAQSLDERADPMVETECFRIAQEALTNIVRHAQASSVQVELTHRNGHLYLLVRDDGVGFDVANQRDAAVRGASLGLLSMEERAALAGGGLQLTSTPGQGTEVRAWFPLKGATKIPTFES